MRLYVRLTHVIPIDIDDDAYDDLGEGVSRGVAAMRADADPDFALDRLDNGPHDVVDVDWEIETDEEWMRRYDDEHVFHTIEAKVKQRVVDMSSSPPPA